MGKIAVRILFTVGVCRPGTAVFMALTAVEAAPPAHLGCKATKQASADWSMDPYGEMM